MRGAVLAVSDVGEAGEFYGRILGLEVEPVGEGLCVAGCVLKLVEGKARHPPGSYLYHVALRVPDRRSLGALLKKVLEFEEVVEGFADHLVSESVYVRDFDGIGVEIYADKPRGRGVVLMDALPLDVGRLLREAGDKPAGVELGHVHMRTALVGEAERFYNALSFKTTYRWRGAAFLAYGDYHHHFAFNPWPVPPPKEGSSLLEVHMGLDVDAADPLGMRLRGSV